MSEEYLVRHCAPTLAGIKTANLFTCPCRNREKLLAFVRRTNAKLVRKGLRILPLRFSEEKALMSDSTAADILQQRGYCTGSCEKCVGQLAKKLRLEEEFPHEIGLFLGYPPEDVCGFLENRTCKCVGCWKVYGDEAAAKKKFAQYKKCTSVYWNQWTKRKDIERLTVAG